MQLSGELTAGAIGIMLTIVSMGLGGIGTVLGIYYRTRTDITKLQVAYLDLKTDLTAMGGKQDVITERMNKQDIMLERISTRIELMGAITNLPDQMAVAISKLVHRDRDAA